MNLWHDIPTGNINAVIEVKKGTKRKYELDKKTGRFILDRLSIVAFPINYGFIPRTLAKDKDPLDIMVYDHKIKKASIVETRPIALLQMKDSGIQDDKILAVPKSYNIKFKDLPKPLLKDIEYFLRIYKGKKTKVFKWLPLKKAKEEIKKAKERYKKCFTN